MSKRADSDETGDVLSSIRRLVADETAAVAPAERLILTPEQRVSAPFVDLSEAEWEGGSAESGLFAEPLTPPPLYLPQTARVYDTEAEALQEPLAPELGTDFADYLEEAESDPVQGLDGDLPPASTGDRLIDPGLAAGLNAPAEGEGNLFEAAETCIDEEVLREYVVGIIRQELQGALGERMTRNVRKLVRSEIQRALASRDFD